MYISGLNPIKDVLFMRKNFFIVILFLGNLAYGQIKEHKCPANSVFQKEKIGNEIICQCVHDSLLNGLTVIYSDKGVKKEENNWDMGMKTGKWKVWNEKSILVYEVTYKNGKEDGEEIYYFDNGKPQVLTTYKDGIKDGRIAEWFDNGQQNTEGYFTNDKQDKIWIFRMPDSKTVSVARYKDGAEQIHKFVSWTKANFSLAELEKFLD